MTVLATSDRTAAEGTRARLLATALGLFTTHSFAGTSLQMIADQLGITKAAVYHHFKTRDEILKAVVEPALDEVRALIADAEAQRSAAARADRMLTGWVDLAVRHRALIALMAADPAIKSMVRCEQDAVNLVDQPRALLAAPHPDLTGEICAEMALCGMSALMSRPVVADLDDETLRAQLLEIGRRMLCLRRPRSA